MKYVLLFTLLISSFSMADVNVDRLKEIVNINSGSANIGGVQAVQDKIKPWFEELGFKVELKENPLNKGEVKVSAPMLIATYPGEKQEAITFIMHADTVFEPSSPFQKWEMKDDHIMHGPGVIDDKGGIIVALQAFKDYFDANKIQNKVPKYTLRVEVTPNEEIGATGWDTTFKEMSKDSFIALGLEPAFQEGGIVEGRKGNIWFAIEVKGKEAHAGVNHKDGINACNILAAKIHEIEKLTDYKKNVTVSIGHIEGGQDKFNIVCGWAKAKLDTRFPSVMAEGILRRKIEAILKDPQITVTIADETPPFATNAISQVMVKKYLDTIEKVEGKRPLSYVSGGVGDANHFSREGIAIIDGLGPKGGAMHTADEFIDLRSISTRAKVLTEFLLNL